MYKIADKNKLHYFNVDIIKLISISSKNNKRRDHLNTRETWSMYVKLFARNINN